MNESHLFTFKSLSELMHYVGLPGPKHPLITIMSYHDHSVKIGNKGDRILMDFYKISFKTSFCGQVKYGQSQYDFEDGGMAFIAPHQLLTTTDDANAQEGLSLYFHSELLRGHPLASKIHKYGFFHYNVSEALFLSNKEKATIASIFHTMSEELDNSIDAFSSDILISQLEQLLNYSNRFYNRQFITRSAGSHELIAKMERLLSEHFLEDRALTDGLPTVKSIAGQLHVSPHYLSDMLRLLTGQNTQQHIHTKLVEKAKNLLSASDLTVAEIAYQLGFEHPQSFSKLFKRKVGSSPVAFRELYN